MRRLNLGCGASRKRDFVNLDLVRWDWVTPDVFGDARSLPFAGESFNWIYSRATIEHIPTWDMERFLGECRRVLKIGGTFQLITIDLIKIFEAWRIKETIEEEFAIGYFYGAKKSPDLPYQNHTTGFTPRRISRFMREAGFTDLLLIDPCEHLLVEIRGRRRS